MRVLGDINPNSTALPDSAARTNESPRFEGWEKLRRGQGQTSDMPLRVTDERYRLECDRLREDEEWQELNTRRPRLSSSVAANASVLETAVEEPKVHHRGNPIEDAPMNVRSVSNELVQEQRQRAANELFANLGYTRVSPRQGTPRRKGAPWTAVLLLVVALAGTVGYGYLTIRENGVSPWRLPGVQTAVVLNQRWRTAQSKATAAVQAARHHSELLIAIGRERLARWWQ